MPGSSSCLRHVCEPACAWALPAACCLLPGCYANASAHTCQPQQEAPAPSARARRGDTGDGHLAVSVTCLLLPRPWVPRGVTVGPSPSPQGEWRAERLHTHHTESGKGVGGFSVSLGQDEVVAASPGVSGSGLELEEAALGAPNFSQSVGATGKKLPGLCCAGCGTGVAPSGRFGVSPAGEGNRGWGGDAEGATRGRWWRWKLLVSFHGLLRHCVPGWGCVASDVVWDKSGVP